ncbi:MAG: hypothetical protein AB7T49_11415 [Oligoflexales bacterium]
MVSIAQRSLPNALKSVVLLASLASTSAVLANHSSQTRPNCDQTPSIYQNNEGEFLFCSSDGRVSFFLIRATRELPYTVYYSVDNTASLEGEIRIFSNEEFYSPIIDVGLQMRDGKEYFVILHEDSRYDIVRTVDGLTHQQPRECGHTTCL